MQLWHSWQAERAAARQAASGGTATEGGSPAAGQTPTAAAGVEAAADVAGGSGGAADPSTEFVLPPTRLPLFEPPADPEERRQVVARLLAGGDEARLNTIAFAREVFRQLPTLGLHDERTDAALGRPQLGRLEPVGVATPPPYAGRPSTARFQVVLQSTPELTVGQVTYGERCLCCDDDVGSGDSGRCVALQLLETLEHEMILRDEIIQSEMGEQDLESLHRSARWFIYRAFVGAKYGHLGQGNRVRIPLCVVGAIRSRYRAPGCDCAASAIATCAAHGYTGHKEVQ